MTRIPPLEPPYHPNFAYAMERTMPPDMAPLVLFRTLATSWRAWDKFAAGSLLDPGPLPIREREIVIERTGARCKCSYEWGVHVTAFARPLGFTDAEIRATVLGSRDDPVWSPKERLLIQLADQLHDTSMISDELWSALVKEYSDEQIIELICIAGFYHAISYMTNACRIEGEAFAEPFPRS